MNVRYPPEVHEFIRQHCKGRSCVELTELVNQHMGTEFTPSKMHAYLGNHKLTLGTPGGNPKGYSPKYPTEMREFVKSMAPGRKTSELLDMVNARFGADTITLQHLRAFMKNHGILNGLESRFQKGHVPYSKGKKQTEFMSAAGIERTKATRFQPGQTPANLLPVGAIVRNPEGYLLRKRAMRGGQWERWEFLHRAIWEEHHGPIPEGLMVSFKNGNKEDCSIDNLMLISNAENLELSRSKLRFDERELTDAGLVVAKLKLKARERRKR